MKTRLLVSIVLSAICLLIVAAGVRSAEQPQLNYTVYLPFVSKPPCTPTRATTYIATSKPVIRVGEIITVTSAIVNECNPLVGQPWIGVTASPPGILSPTEQTRTLYTDVPSGTYTETQFLLQAIGTGPVTVTIGVSYETLNDSNPPMYRWDIAIPSHTVVRVLPNQ
jgi:hypothetical protein